MTPDELAAIRERDIQSIETAPYFMRAYQDRRTLLAHVEELEARLEAVKEECADLIAGKEYQAMQRSLAECNARLADMEARLAEAEAAGAGARAQTKRLSEMPDVQAHGTVTDQGAGQGAYLSRLGASDGGAVGKRNR